jgi:hypothetical protein
MSHILCATLSPILNHKTESGHNLPTCQLTVPTGSCYFQSSQVAFLFTKYNLDYSIFWIWFLWWHGLTIRKLKDIVLSAYLGMVLDTEQHQSPVIVGVAIHVFVN